MEDWRVDVKIKEEAVEKAIKVKDVKEGGMKEVKEAKNELKTVIRVAEFISVVDSVVNIVGDVVINLIGDIKDFSRCSRSLFLSFFSTVGIVCVEKFWEIEAA